MARYIRIYESPESETHGSILGFSSEIAYGARNPELLEWLAERGYTVTPESDMQIKANLHLDGFARRTVQHHDIGDIAIRRDTVSAGHLLMEPPLKDEHLWPLAEFLSQLDSIDDSGFTMRAFIDNRSEEARPYDFSLDSAVVRW